MDLVGLVFLVTWQAQRYYPWTNQLSFKSHFNLRFNNKTWIIHINTNVNTHRSILRVWKTGPCWFKVYQKSMTVVSKWASMQHLAIINDCNYLHVCFSYWDKSKCLWEKLYLANTSGLPWSQKTVVKFQRHQMGASVTFNCSHGESCTLYFFPLFQLCQIRAFSRLNVFFKTMLSLYLLWRIRIICK